MSAFSGNGLALTSRRIRDFNVPSSTEAFSGFSQPGVISAIALGMPHHLQ
jgi:hypothetical protein